MKRNERKECHEMQARYAHAQYNVNYFGLSACKDEWED